MPAAPEGMILADDHLLANEMPRVARQDLLAAAKAEHAAHLAREPYSCPLPPEVSPPIPPRG